MKLQDFMDMEKIQVIQDRFSTATGLAAIAVDAEGNYITKESNFTDFCIKYTRGSEEGSRRCTKCDNECTGTYYCHANLMDFSADIIVNGEKLGAMIGGQVLPEEPNEEEFRKLAKELDIDPDAYIAALKKVPIRSEKSIRAAADLLNSVINEVVNLEYIKSKDNDKLSGLDTEINRSAEVMQTINEKTHELKSIASKQKILALNASIEAARSGEAGVGFTVVAKSMGDLSSKSAIIYNDIEKSVEVVADSIQTLSDLFKEKAL